MAQSSKRRQVVMTFGERPDLRSSSLRGGKGASLADMRSLGLPVPPGFTITTTVARAQMQHGVFPKRFKTQLLWGIQALERETGKRFGDPSAPLLVSVRSGAEHSMPGMMDTILNLGMNEEIAKALAEREGKTFAEDCLCRFQTMYAETVFGVKERTPAIALNIPSDPWEQLRDAIKVVFDSWNSERAVVYRKAHGIKEHLGTAVTVQAMVFGNRDHESSGTGVAFSCNPNTGASELFGEFLPGAQGEDIVSGQHAPMPLSFMKTWNERVYHELVTHVRTLERHFDTVVDVEFTVENGVLYLLQCRPAKLSAEAAATNAVHRVWKKQWTKSEAVGSLSSEQLALLRSGSFSQEEIEQRETVLIGRGIPASQGVAVGEIAWSPEEAIAMAKEGRSPILYRGTTDPSDLPGMLVSKAIVTFTGGATCHAAIVARQLGIPAVVNMKHSDSVVRKTPRGTIVSVCGYSGSLYSGELRVSEQSAKKEINLFFKWMNSLYSEPRIHFGAAKERRGLCTMLMDTYLLEAMVQESKGTKLGGELYVYQQKFMVSLAEFLAGYLAVAVASELRNAKPSHMESSQFQELERFYHFTPHEWQRGDERVLDTLKSKSHEQQVHFFRLASAVFRLEGWGKSFGGPKWAVISDAALQYLTKQINHAVFVDHVFDLEHNCGHVFDKHAMVKIMCTGDDFKELLDTKRDVTGVSQLHGAFMQRVEPMSRRWGRLPGLSETLSIDFIKPSSGVLAFWERGQQLKIWRRL